MYPKAIIFGIDLYTILLCVGIVAALLTFRIFSDRNKMYWKLQNFTIITGVVSITVGYGSAALFQAFYNFLADRESGFHFKGTTFYGGLVGGAATFLLVYFVLGRFFFKDKIHINGFFSIANIAAASIAVAHAFGRVGCLMAGVVRSLFREQGNKSGADTALRSNISFCVVWLFLLQIGKKEDL